MPARPSSIFSSHALCLVILLLLTTSIGPTQQQLQPLFSLPSIDMLERPSLDSESDQDGKSLLFNLSQEFIQTRLEQPLLISAFSVVLPIINQHLSRAPPSQ